MVKEDKAKSFSKCFHGDKTNKRIPFPLRKRKQLTKTKPSGTESELTRFTWPYRGDTGIFPIARTHIQTQTDSTKITNMKFGWD